MCTVAELKRHGTTEKTRHTKLSNKIAKYIAERQDVTELTHLRIQLLAVFEFGEEAHLKYVTDADLTEDAAEIGWMESFRNSHIECLNAIHEYSKCWTSSLTTEVDQASMSRSPRGELQQVEVQDDELVSQTYASRNGEDRSVSGNDVS